jgi:hypothetical protein
MALDRALEDALRRAVKEEGQPDAVAARLIAWTEALADGEDSVEDQDRFYGRLMAAIALGKIDDED